MATPSVRELTDIPIADSNLSEVNVLAMGDDVFIAFRTRDAGTKGTGAIAVVHFWNCLNYMGGSPNDEAFQNLPLYGHGLKYYCNQEIVDSPWVTERAAIADRDRDSQRLAKGRRHFVVSLKEGTFECIALGYKLLGTFPTLREAFAAAAATSTP